MRTNAVIRIIAYSLAIILLLSILIGFLFFGMYFESGRVRSHLSEEHIAPTEGQVTQFQFSDDIKNIEIEWVSGSITVRPSETVNGIYVAEHMGHDVTKTMVCKQSGQTLKIQFSDESIKFPSFGINVDYSKDLTIDVPADWVCNSLEIDTASADVEIENLTIREFDFDGASGNLILDNCNVTELDVDTASGYVEFIGALEKLDFDAASAKFYGEFYDIPRSLNMDSMSGDLEIVLPEDSGFEMEKESLSGTFGTDFEITTDGNLYKCGDGACKIKINAVSGNVSILKGVSTP